MQLHELSRQTHDRLGGAGLDPNYVADIIRHTIAEDLDGGIDVTSVATVPIAQRSIATFGARAHGCVAGLDIAAAVIEMVCGASASSFEYKKKIATAWCPEMCWHKWKHRRSSCLLRNALH